MSNQEQEQALLIQKRRRNIIDGAFYEPRILYDAYLANAGLTAQSVIENEDEWPIRITHMIASIAPLPAGQAPDTPSRGDERILAVAQLRITAHDTPFFNYQRVPIGALGNVVTASASANPGLASWNLPKVLRYGGRDTLEVETELVNTPEENGREVSVILSGNGRKSGTPYIVQSKVGPLTDFAAVELPTEDFRVDAAEAVDVQNVGVHVSGDFGGTDLRGDAREARIQITQRGNGTHTPWFQGPADRPLMLASLLGVSCGRSIVRALPYDAQDQERGLLLYPDQGLTVEVDFPDEVPRNDNEEIWIGFAGYAIIT